MHFTRLTPYVVLHGYAEPEMEIRNWTNGGTHTTLLAGTVSENRSVPWTKPDDIRFDDTFQSKENAFVEGAFIFANGSVLQINIQDDLDLAKFRSLFTIKAGETNTVGSLYPPERNFSSFPKTDSVEEALQYSQAAEKRMAISDALKEIVVAFHNYHAANERAVTESKP